MQALLISRISAEARWCLTSLIRQPCFFLWLATGSTLSLGSLSSRLQFLYSSCSPCFRCGTPKRCFMLCWSLLYSSGLPSLPVSMMLSHFIESDDSLRHPCGKCVSLSVLFNCCLGWRLTQLLCQHRISPCFAVPLQEEPQVCQKCREHFAINADRCRFLLGV